MSHFVVLALLTPEQATDRKTIEKSLETLLEPFSEHRQVESYQRECYCVGWKAKTEAIKLAKADGIDNFKIKTDYYNLPEEEKTDDKWAAMIQPYIDACDAHEKAQPDYNKPDPNCSICDGVGTYKSEYNPQSKWDWWTIGGRWTGMLSPDYDPNKDPDNIKTCNFCNGTGKRSGDDCNSCNGTGQAIKWPTEWKEFDGDIMPLAQVSDETIPFAILTPDGRWFERGEMGWFGMVKDEKEESSWAKTVQHVRAEYGDSIAVVVDCHI